MALQGSEWTTASPSWAGIWGPSFYMPLFPQQGMGQAEFGPLIFRRARGGLCGVCGKRLGCGIWSTTPHALGKLLSLSTTQLPTCKMGCPPFQTWLQG